MPLIEWLDRTEKQVKDMELIPTDEEKIQQRIKEHNVSYNLVRCHNMNQITLRNG